MNEGKNGRNGEIAEDCMTAAATEVKSEALNGNNGQYNTNCDKKLPGPETDFFLTKPPVSRAKITTTSLPTHMKVPENGTVVIQHSVDQPDVASTWKLNGVQLENGRDCKVGNINILNSYSADKCS